MGIIPVRICAVDGCGRVVRSKGLCKKHYEYNRLNGHTGPVAPRTDFGPTCTAEGCDKKNTGRGFCAMHRYRLGRHGTLEPTRIIGDDKARFLSKVDKNGPTMPHMDTPCWVWVGGKNHNGYGIFYAEDYSLAHRYSYEFFNSTSPEDAFVCHECDNPPCVNPEHLWLGDYQANTTDMIRKGRAKRVRGEASGMSKLTDKKIRQIRDLSSSGVSNLELSRRFGVADSTIGRVVLRKTWQHVE